MITMFEPLFRPYAAVERPVRYFLLLFMMFQAALHIINDVILLYYGSEFMEMPRLYIFSILMTAFVFVSGYFRQKKEKQLADQSINA